LSGGNAVGELNDSAFTVSVGAGTAVITAAKERREAENNDDYHRQEGERAANDQRSGIAFGAASKEALEGALRAGNVTPGPPIRRRFSGREPTHALGPKSSVRNQTHRVFPKLERRDEVNGCCTCLESGRIVTQGQPETTHQLLYRPPIGIYNRNWKTPQLTAEGARPPVLFFI
jgi:hypothetical protein